MSKEISVETLKKLISSVSSGNKNPVAEGENLFDSGHLDSFSVMKLVQELESSLGIVFDYQDLRLQYFKTLETILALLAKKYGVREAKK